MLEERVIRFRPRTVLAVLAIVIAVFVLLNLLWMARSVLTWIIIALFLTIALNPIVERLQARGMRRGAAVALTMLGVLGVFAAIGVVLVPILVDPVGGFSNAVPGYVEDLTKGRGPLGFLETDYH